MKGNFKTFDGTITIAANALDSTVEATVHLELINTRDEKRDGHLKSADFFDVENHPTMTFVSTVGSTAATSPRPAT